MIKTKDDEHCFIVKTVTPTDGQAETNIIALIEGSNAATVCVRALNRISGNKTEDCLTVYSWVLGEKGAERLLKRRGKIARKVVE